MARRSKAEKRRLGRAVAVLLVVALIAAIVFGIYWFAVKGRTWDDLKALFGEKKTERPSDIGEGDFADILSAELSIHFIAPAVKASGDCTLIKVGDTEVLIDAGPTQGNVTEIKEYLSDYCTDGILEYVIATHADTDHIAGLVGTSSGGEYNGILYSYKESNS